MSLKGPIVFRWRLRRSRVVIFIVLGGARENRYLRVHDIAGLGKLFDLPFFNKPKHQKGNFSTDFAKNPKFSGSHLRRSPVVVSIWSGGARKN